jgi:hypothetical protein
MGRFMPTGTFLLADIGDYTRLLSDVGIEHAKEITSHLFNRIVEVKPGRWKVGNAVGDCLFRYDESDASPDELFASVRGVYETFRNTIAEVAAGPPVGAAPAIARGISRSSSGSIAAPARHGASLRAGFEPRASAGTEVGGAPRGRGRVTLLARRPIASGP